jgi:hypothetical protein
LALPSFLATMTFQRSLVTSCTCQLSDKYFGSRYGNGGIAETTEHGWRELIFQKVRTLSLVCQLVSSCANLERASSTPEVVSKVLAGSRQDIIVKQLVSTCNGKVGIMSLGHFKRMTVSFKRPLHF